MSKLIELMLAADIKWPAGAKFAVQDDDGLVKTSSAIEPPTLSPDGVIWNRGKGGNDPALTRIKVADDWDTTIVTVYDYYLVGGWIEYGDPVPLQSCNHEFQYINGLRIQCGIEDANNIAWPQVKYFRRVISQPGLYDIHVDPVVIEPVEPVIIGDTDHSWYERGEFPSVGCECQFFSDGYDENWFDWCIFHGLASCGGLIVEHHHRTSPSRVTVCLFDPRTTKFRPLRTERQKAIENMVKILKRFDCSPHEIAEAMVDAGYHK